MIHATLEVEALRERAQALSREAEAGEAENAAVEQALKALALSNAQLQQSYRPAFVPILIWLTASPTASNSCATCTNSDL